jgi:hypothetical protein
MKFLFRLLPIVLSGLFLFWACKKDKKVTDPVTNDPPPASQPTPSTVPTPTAGPTGSLKLEFRNVVDDQPLALGGSYTNPAGETYTISKFKYYISNIVLTTNTNTEVEVKNLYQIVDQADDTSRTVVLRNIPPGNYRAIRFLLGVDSTRNRSGAQTGGLDVVYAQDMYWSWSQGYIFLKLEGASPSSTLSSKGIEYHMGGFGGVNKAQRPFSYEFAGQVAEVSALRTPTLVMKTEVNEMFKTPSLVSFATTPVVIAAGTRARQLADNYADMITLLEIRNE